MILTLLLSAMIYEHNPSNRMFTYVLFQDNDFDPRQMNEVYNTEPWNSSIY